MDKIFEKLGIYDFMGVWGPGAIFCICTSITFPEIVNTLSEKLKMSSNWLYVLLYIGIAYLFGVLFHEIGKWLCDKITYFFDYEQYYDIKKLNLKSNVNSCVFTPRSLQYRYRKILKDCGVSPAKPFDRVYSDLKYKQNIDMKRLNLYHSVYGLSRGLFIAAIVHFILTIVFLCKEKVCPFCEFNKLSFYFFVDILLMYIFFCRTVRYFISWVMNTYIQHSLLFKNY